LYDLLEANKKSLAYQVQLVRIFFEILSHLLSESYVHCPCLSLASARTYFFSITRWFIFVYKTCKLRKVRKVRAHISSYVYVVLFSNLFMFFFIY